MNATMNAATCLHCDANLTSRELSEGWCDTCGKKLPSGLTHSRPATLRPASRTRARAAAKNSAARVLFAIAGIQALGGIAVLVLVGSRNVRPPQSMVLLALGELLVTATVFVALGIWAKSSPRAAATVGLCVYLPLALISAALNPTMLGVAIKILLLVYLIKAVGDSTDAPAD